MMLHCTPPYIIDIPNPALGYLKGFLEAKGIPVKNIYWNLVLFQEIQEFNKGMEHLDSNLFSNSAITILVSRYLMAKNSDRRKLLDDPFFLLIRSRDELSQLIDAIETKIDQYIRENNLHKAQCAGFTFKSQQWFMGSYIGSRLKEMNPDMNIVIGGMFNEDQARAFMKVFHQADFAIWGEGEYPLFHLIEALKEGKDLNKVPQLVYRDPEIVSTHQSQERVSLDEYPFADHSDYFSTLEKFVPGTTKVMVPIWGSRGCPWNKCKFCVLNEKYSYRVRSPENVVAEIEYQATAHNVDTFFFVDTDFAGNKKRFKTLLKCLIQLSEKRNEPYYYIGDTTPIYIDPEMVASMRRASFEFIQSGFEALTDSLLEKMQKRHKFAHNIQALKLGKRYHLNMRGLNTVRGTPAETAEDILESCSNLKFLRFFLNTYTLDTSPFALYKGSPFYDEMPEEERKAWNYHRFWIEISPTGLIPESDRFEFFGFFREGSQHSLWDDFDMVMKFYKQQNYSYTWIEYANGSFIEEKGPKTYRFTLDRDETDILIFCDLVKPYREVGEKFSHISEENLRIILHTLNKVGFLYYDQNMDTIISVLDMTERESVSQM